MLTEIDIATQMVLKTYTDHRTASRNVSGDATLYADDDDEGSTSAPSESEYYSATEEA